VFSVVKFLTILTKQKGEDMWQCWVMFYIGLWILASGIMYGGSIKFSNIVFGGLIVILSLWAGIKARNR